MREHKPLLLVLNPRRIPECVEAIADLPIDRVWLRNYTEAELAHVIPAVLAETDHDVIGVLSDDGIPTRAALAEVLDLYDPAGVVTGYCNLDAESPLVNLSTEPLTDNIPAEETYSPPTREWVASSPDRRVRTYFAGHCLTFMHRDLWDRFPWSYHGDPPGCASDLALSWRLQEAGIGIVAARDAFIWHVKERWNHVDDTPGRELLIGREPSAVVWDLNGGTA